MVTTCKDMFAFETYICNSNRIRPTRWDAQADAVNLIFSAKTGANPESSVGLMSMGGQGPEMLTTLTTDVGKILDGLHRTKIKGSSHFSTGINIAAVGLRWRTPYIA